MYDELGNGLDAKDRQNLLDMNGMYQSSYYQRGNHNMVFTEKWRYADKINLLKAWFSLDRPKGVLLSIDNLTISTSREIHMEEYFEILQEESKKGLLV